MKSHSFMSCFLLTITALWAAVPASAQESPEPPAAARSLAALTQDARIALRAEATLEAPEAWELAVRTLVALNDELRVHPKNREGSSFAKLKRSLHRRILKAQKKLARAEGEPPADLAVGNAADQPVVRQAAGAEAGRDDGGDRLQRDPADVLAQQGGGFQAGGGGRGGFGAGGGPGGAGFGPGGAQPGDYGDTLVDLIERTISADVWDSAGGPAVIRYYQPNQALIISAPAEVHDNISELLRQLRATASP